jgi:DHA1 family tetracycline resistance protein-like MFS transporter
MLRAWIPISLIVFFEGFVLWTVLPTLHRFTLELGGSPIMFGALFASMSLPKLLTNPLLGRLSDRGGRRPVLMISGFGSILASLLWANADSLTILAISRVVAGCAGVQAAIAQSIVADLTVPSRRAAGMGWIGAAFGLAIVVGPISGAHIADTYGVSVIGWWAVGSQLISMLLIIFALPETLPSKRSPVLAPSIQAEPNQPSAAGTVPTAKQPGISKTLLRIPGVMRLLLCVGLLMAANGQLTTTLGYVLEKVFTWELRDLGYALSSLGIVGVVVQGGVLRILLRVWPTQHVSLLGCGALALGAGLLALAVNNAMIWIGLGSFGVGLALVQPTTSALLSNRIPPEHQGRMLGLNQAITAGGRGLGAALAGALLSASWRAPYSAGSILALSVAVMLWNLPSHLSAEEKAKATQD